MRTAVVIPCFRVKSTLVQVVQSLPKSVSFIIAVDDACPDKSGESLQAALAAHPDPRVHVLFHSENQGVGGAMITGYQKALALGAEILIKMDGDGQMDPRYLGQLIQPIVSGRADYTKGNRFFKKRYLDSMPKVRLIGNALLSLSTKLVTGYWKVMDPTNGYTAIHSTVLRHLDFDRMEKRYYFESDLLYQLGLIRAVVLDVPMPAVYEGAGSSLRIGPIIRTWPAKMIQRFVKRIVINYYVRDFNPASVELLFAFWFLVFGFTWSIAKFLVYANLGQNTPSGVVMIGVLPIFLGFQLLISAFHYDVENTPTIPIQELLPVSDNEKK